MANGIELGTDTVSPQKRTNTRDRSGPQNSNQQIHSKKIGPSKIVKQEAVTTQITGPEDPLRQRKTLHKLTTSSSKTLGQPGVHHATSTTAMQNSSNYQLRQ
jgi:hypothetical protein